MDKIRKNVVEIMEQLEQLSNNNYRTFELALVLFLRSDLFTLKNYITDNDLERLEDIIHWCDSLMSDSLRYSVDDVITESHISGLSQKEVQDNEQ